MKSVIVIGMGRFGRHLAEKMVELGNDVMIVDKDPELISQLSVKFTDSQIGDCTNSKVVDALGVNHFDICFVTMGEDFQSSLVVTSLAKRFKAKHVVAKANQEIQADLLLKIGADEVVYPEKEMAEKLAVRYNSKNIFDYIQLTSEYSMFEIPIMHEWVGKSISDINVRRKYKVNIIAVKQGNSLSPMPGPDYEFVANDHVVLIGKSTDAFKIASKTD